MLWLPRRPRRSRLWSICLHAPPRILRAAHRVLARHGVLIATTDRADVLARVHPGSPLACDVLVRVDPTRVTSAWLEVTAQASGAEHLGALVGTRLTHFLQAELVVGQEKVSLGRRGVAHQAGAAPPRA